MQTTVPSFISDILGDRLKNKDFGNEPLIEVSDEVHQLAQLHYDQMHVSEHTVMRTLLGYLNEEETAEFATSCAWWAPLLDRDETH